MTMLDVQLADEQRRCRALLCARINANLGAGDLADALRRAEWAVLDRDSADMIGSLRELRGFQ